ncbi:hypothetical protein [Flavobacterium cerinum]|uniref:HEAT repeat domain-containing protein n=1 Tax=Flavobacterium cerinum TaxID=2502784 RepID=A0A444HCK4_9FLAO|nr:hypothetical protein [Flavobacterium cerinum]RWX01412.1 hypothetical protein EPI11_05500 [Flavobacterium cerinum]
MEKYLKPLYDFLAKGEWYLEEPEFINLQYEIVDEMEADKIGFDAIENILELMEKNPLVEFGTPGPLTHFIEKFYKERQEDYVNLLKKSVKDKPTVHTVWLLNRVINENKKQELIGILNSISKDKEIKQEIRDVANNFLEYHQNK